MGCVGSKPASADKYEASDCQVKVSPKALHGGPVSSTTESVQKPQSVEVQEPKPDLHANKDIEIKRAEDSAHGQSVVAKGLSQQEQRSNSRWERSAVDKGTQLIESLSAIEGTAIEKLEAFTNLLISESYVQFASVSVLSEDQQVFMLLTAAGIGSAFLPKNVLLSTASTPWSVQRVLAEGQPVYWAAGDSDPDQLPEDWKCLMKTEVLRSFLAVPIKVAAQLCGVLNVALAAEVDEHKHWWGLQLRLLAAVLAQHFQDAQLRANISWIHDIARQESVSMLCMATLQGLRGMFADLSDLSFHLALLLPGQPAALMFTINYEAGSSASSLPSAAGSGATPGGASSSEAALAAARRRNSVPSVPVGAPMVSGSAARRNSVPLTAAAAAAAARAVGPDLRKQAPSGEDPGSQDDSCPVQEEMAIAGFIATDSLLEAAVETYQVMKVANCRRYMRSYTSAHDVAVLIRHESLPPASVMVVPLITPDSARLGGLYITSSTATDFGMVRNEVVDLVKLMAPLLHQKLSNELSAELLQVADRCHFETGAPTAVVRGTSGAELSTGDSLFEGPRELVAGAKTEKDALIGELQEQIRKQLAKVYRASSSDGNEFAVLSDLEVYDEVGKGGYGTVYRALYKGQMSAVKVVFERDHDGGSLNSALELALLTSISHPNIIQIHTYYADIKLTQLKFMRESLNSHAGRSSSKAHKRRSGGQQHYRQQQAAPGVARGQGQQKVEQSCQVLVMDYCDMGSLGEVLHTSLLRQHGGAVSMSAILHCLLEVASAIYYLHSIGIVHYDLKPENVLLKSSTIDCRGFTCKVADFGLSNMVGDNSYFSKHAEGTITHLAPEAMQPSSKLTRAVDAYAFGIMMWELFTGQRPYCGMRAIDVAVRVARDGLRPEFPGHTPSAYRALAEQCWQDDRRGRPTFRQIMTSLHAMLKSLPPGPTNSSALAMLGATTTAARMNRFGPPAESGGATSSSEFPLHIL